MNGLIVAFGFLTRLPVPRITIDARAQAASLKWYPLVGLVLGVLLVGVGALRHAIPTLPAAAIVLAAWVALTGGLHLDGLADSADGWIGGMGDRERTLSIMKDPRSGPAGVVALVLILLLKFSALATLSHSWLLLLPPLLGRGAVIAWFQTTDYVRSQGLGEPLRSAPSRGCVAALVLTVTFCLFFGTPGVVALIAACVTAWVWRRAGIHRLGGFTGDTAGALVELVEAVTVVVLAGMSG